METRPLFGYVSTLSLKSTLIINELYFSPWPRPDVGLVETMETLAEVLWQSPETLAPENALFRVAVTLDLIPFATCKVRHEDRLAAIFDGRC